MSALLVIGPRAVGKSTVAWAVFSDLARAGEPVAYLDLAQLGFLHRPAAAPPGPDLPLRNLAAAWRVFAQSGTRHLVLSGDLRTPDSLRACAQALPGLPLTTCHLHATPAVLAERLLARGRGEGPPIPGDDLRGRPIAELRRLAAEPLPHKDIGQIHLHTDRHGPAEVAEQARKSWLDP